MKKSGFYCEFRESGAPVIREYRGDRVFRESDAVGYQGIAVLPGHDNDLIIGFGSYYEGSHGLEAGVAYRLAKIIY